MQALMKNQTWEVVNLEKGMNPVGCRLVFTIKYNSDGTIERYKTRLVAKGYTQTYGVDYEETFAPVAKMNTIQILMSLAVNLNWKLKQYDILKYYLGIEVAQSSSGYLMTQLKYILDLLNETKLLQGKANSTPIETNHKLTLKKDDLTVEIGSYQRLIGKLLYLSHTRPDISYSVNVLTQFMHSPQKSHYHAALQILRYLKRTAGLGLTFRRTSKLNLEIYTDSEFGGSLIDRRSTTGYCAMLGGNLITWKSKK